MTATLPALGRVAAHWRRRLAHALAADLVGCVVVDLLSSDTSARSTPPYPTSRSCGCASSGSPGSAARTRLATIFFVRPA
jgi:hypothetical protein